LRRAFMLLVGSVAAVWPVVGHAQQPPMMEPTQTMRATLPRIEVVRVKRIDPAAPKSRPRLSDGEVDLMKEFSLGSLEGIGGGAHSKRTAPAGTARLAERPSAYSVSEREADDQTDCNFQHSDNRASAVTNPARANKGRGLSRPPIEFSAMPPNIQGGFLPAPPYLKMRPPTAKQIRLIFGLAPAYAIAPFRFPNGTNQTTPS
jgi:hypothetical protein